jgi:hypothetical protein
MSIDPVSAGLDLGTELLKLVNNCLRFFPDYSQKKIEDYHYHHDRYINEMAKEWHFRDDNRIDWHRDQMVIIAKDFSAFIENKTKTEVK